NGATINPVARERTVNVLPNLMATSRGSRGRRKIDGVIIPKTGESHSATTGHTPGRSSPQRHREHGEMMKIKTSGRSTEHARLLPAQAELFLSVVSVRSVVNLFFGFHHKAHTE